jgi:exodeoxyribonuclease VII small subunit
MSMSTPVADKLPFETALEQLQQTVKRLESGELSLEQAIQAFEEGVKLSALCSEHLTSAEQKVEVLMKGTGQGGDSGPEFQSFNPGGR